LRILAAFLGNLPARRFLVNDVDCSIFPCFAYCVVFAAWG
jgi:hypothetical protein